MEENFLIISPPVVTNADKARAAERVFSRFLEGLMREIVTTKETNGSAYDESCPDIVGIIASAREIITEELLHALADKGKRGMIGIIISWEKEGGEEAEEPPPPTVSLDGFYFMDGLRPPEEVAVIASAGHIGSPHDKEVVRDCLKRLCKKNPNAVRQVLKNPKVRRILA